MTQDMYSISEEKSNGPIGSYVWKRVVLSDKESDVEDLLVFSITHETSLYALVPFYKAIDTLLDFNSVK